MSQHIELVSQQSPPMEVDLVLRHHAALPLFQLSEGLETPIQLIYLLTLLGFLGAGAFLVVRQVLIRRELDEAAKQLGERIRTGEASCEVRPDSMPPACMHGACGDQWGSCKPPARLTHGARQGPVHVLFWPAAHCSHPFSSSPDAHCVPSSICPLSPLGLL